MTFSVRKTLGISTLMVACFTGDLAVAEWHGSSSNVHSNTRSVSLHDKENWLYAEHEGNRFDDSITRNASGCSATAPVPTFTANVSAYCPCELCCGIYADGVTASGHVIQPGDKFVAADPSIPFGTLLDVPGYGIVPVLDRGGAIKGNKLDLYFDTHAEALLWGRKQLRVRRM